MDGGRVCLLDLVSFTFPGVYVASVKLSVDSLHSMVMLKCCTVGYLEGSSLTTERLLVCAF